MKVQEVDHGEVTRRPSAAPDACVTAPAPRERPILMRGELVVASFEDRKTHTRRPVKLPSEFIGRGGWEPTTIGGPGTTDRNGRPVREEVAIWNTSTGTVIACPYGAPGDRLWVKETFAIVPGCQWPDLPRRVAPGAIQAYAHYRAGFDRSHGFRWKPSIHMPRWASRLLLEIVEVRIERVQSITEEDAKREGLRIPDAAIAKQDVTDVHGMTPYRAAFAAKWSEIYKSGPFAWDANPWVWAITYRRVR